MSDTTSKEVQPAPSVSTAPIESETEALALRLVEYDDSQLESIIGFIRNILAVRGYVEPGTVLDTQSLLGHNVSLKRTPTSFELVH